MPRRAAEPVPGAGGRRRPAPPPDVVSLRRRIEDLLADFSRADLEDFLHTPAFAPGPDTDALRRALDGLTLGDDQRTTS
ncbi:hypothetical protein [Isoptericola sp. NPDC019571]|uniref:hypothetical protein n=1 Tax=Isoptericola sp. NPDC019571 TaxID=3364008 RepID=UPI0037BB183E